MRSEYTKWATQYNESQPICFYNGAIAAWEHQQFKVDELQKRVDKAIRLLVEAELYQSEPNIDLAVQALKGGEE